MLDEQFKIQEKQILDQYRFSRQNLDFKDFSTNINQKTEFTSIYLGAITWLHQNKTLDLKEYILQMIHRPQKLYEELTNQIENILERGEALQREPKQQENLPNAIPSSSSQKEKEKDARNANSCIRLSRQKIEEDFIRKEKAPRKSYKKL